MKMPFVFYILGVFLAAIVALPACTNTAKKVQSPDAYNLENPERFTMPGSLLEISGICFKPGEGDTIYAVQDEQGKVFKLQPGQKKLAYTKFANNGDYEDITFLNKNVMVLKSNGSLSIFPQNKLNMPEADSVTVMKNLLPEGEYEGLYADEASNKLYVLCKKCEEDKGTDNLSVYVLQLQGGSFSFNTIQININENVDINAKLKSAFRPSALSKNPVTGEWFIISGTNKILVVTDADFKVKQTYALSGNRFNQPEGIAFDGAGNLYISNEGDELSEGNILKFVRNAH